MSESRTQKIRQRTVVGFSLAGSLALLLVVAAQEWGAAFTTVAGAALACLGIFEAQRMGTLDGRAAAGAWTATVATAVVILGEGGGTRFELEDLSAVQQYWLTLGGALGLCALVGLISALPAGSRIFRRLGLTLWLAAPLPLLGLMRDRLGIEGLAALLVLSKIGDVAGYYGGQFFGANSSHPFPKLSPGKTSVGCFCSLVTAVAAGTMCVSLGWLPGGSLGLISGALAGALVNLAAQAGDLLESSAKRSAGVKDSGTWFGPSGGMLDLVDSLLLSVPVAALGWPWLLDMLG